LDPDYNLRLLKTSEEDDQLDFVRKYDNQDVSSVYNNNEALDSNQRSFDIPRKSNF